MLRLDPHLAVFRRTPDRIAIGAQAPVAELDADPPTLRAIAALTRGVLPRELAQLVGDDAARTLLATIAPAVLDEPPAIPTLVRGRVPLAERLHRAARDSGHPAGNDGVIVPVAPWRLPDAEVARLRGAGTAHLPVIVGDAWLQVGPFVPAGGACTRCAPKQSPVLPAHLTPAASPIAAAQCVVTVLDALRRASDDALPAGWAVRIRQRDGTVSALRRRPCPHLGARPARGAARSRPGIAKAA
ncbi:hypothetical protein [Agrococcus sp. ProA11]|uniref:hypothetical protein n=1 Tax=Agrococcus chionoecetis TaxID=3153752 RepID=UPI00326023D0